MNLRYSPFLRRYIPSSTKSLNLSNRYRVPPPPPTPTLPISTTLDVLQDGKVSREGKERLVGLPLRPNPPEEGECCMSGCAICVYDLYLEDLETYKLSLRNYKEGLFERMKGLGERERKEIEQNWPRDVLGDFKEGPAGEAEENGKDQMDPATRAFLEMEAKMKKKQQEGR